MFIQQLRPSSLEPSPCAGVSAGRRSCTRAPTMARCCRTGLSHLSWTGSPNTLQKYHDPRVTSPWALHSTSLHLQPQSSWETPVTSLLTLIQGEILEELRVLTHLRALGAAGSVVWIGKEDIPQPIFSPFFFFA